MRVDTKVMKEMPGVFFGWTERPVSPEAQVSPVEKKEGQSRNPRMESGSI